ncbi:kinesin-like protein KIN-10C isoform X2 [Silene latifolia]|uniref:kinesin-like protein KIN-10C isoform X2 n=1 Tax=Silene latifolia TaxID=37657 RepID=UPI003D783C16
MASIGSGRVRIVARIRGSLNKDVESLPVKKSAILVSRPDSNGSGWVKISFNSDQITSGKQSYEVDECYEEGVGNEELFSKEIKPLISGLFEGQNATVFAYGSRGSGKTYTIQGSDEEYGLVTFTLEGIFPRVGEEGKVVNVSVFEVCQDRIIDLLDSKRSEVLVLEDVLGKIKLKGLSKVKLNSTEEYQKLYSDAVNNRMQKAAEPPHRSHLGCILHVVSPQTENAKAKLVGKINFIDLASYEDCRRVSSDGLNLTDTTRIKKSLNVVHSVLYALNAKERVPYRESKLTRMLQDSLGGSSSTLMVTCINPSFCQETVQTISISSRSCTAYVDPIIKSGKSAKKATGMFSPQVMKSTSNLMASPQISKSTSKPSTHLMSPKVLKATSASSSARKQSTSHLSVRKASGGVGVQKKERKVVANVNQHKSPKQVHCTLESEETVDLSSQLEVNGTLESEETVDLSTQLEIISEADSSQLFSEKETSNASLDVNSSQFILEEDVIQAENNVTATPSAYKTPTTGNYLLEGKENKLNDGSSPPLSARIRDLSNNLKSLCFSTEAKLKMTQENSRFSNQVIHENFEPKTPTSQIARASEKYSKTNNASPWSTMKDSLVQESLKILNSATKEELKGLKGIGEKRATYILEFRDESPEPFKTLDDLKDIGLSEKQIKELVKNVAGNLLS